MVSPRAARGESPTAFGRRCIPADCVTPPSDIPDILGRRALSAGRLAALGATPDFHHGLLLTPEILRIIRAAGAVVVRRRRVRAQRARAIDDAGGHMCRFDRLRLLPCVDPLIER